MKHTLELRLLSQKSSLDNLLENLSEESIRFRPVPDKWSVFENIAHLGRYQEVFSERLQRILDSESPLFERYVADNDPQFEDWCKKSWQKLMDDFNETRAQLNQLVLFISPENLSRNGIHPVFGPLTIEGWTEFFLLHEAHHFFTIFKLATTLKPKK